MQSHAATESSRPTWWEGLVRRLRHASDLQFVRVLALVGLYTFAAYLRLREVSMLDPDIWWHVRTGEWILAHHHIPHTDLFSQFGLGKPWVAYSWLFEVVVAKLTQQFGLVGVFAYELAMRVAITVAVHHLLYGLVRKFWTSVALTAICVYSMLHVLGTRPVLFSVIFSAVTLDVILRARRNRATRVLWILPPVYCVWANIHVQFVYGLAIFALFTFEPLADAVLARARWSEARERMRPMLAAFVVTAGATLINPYGLRLYALIFDLARQTKLYDLITELHAPDFRSTQEYVILFLIMGACVAIGYRRRFPVALTILLIFAAVSGFRATRDAWFAAIVSAVVLAGEGSAEEIAAEQRRTAPRIRWQLAAAVTLGIAAVLIVAARYHDLNNDWLELSVQSTFPDAAARYIEAHHLPGPILNDFNWGGYLIWRLPEYPVAIDGRSNIHRQDRVEEFANLWGAKGDWRRDPELLRANTILANQKTSLARALRFDGDYRAVYEDSLAVVFVRRR